jgi:MFS family permease
VAGAFGVFNALGSVGFLLGPVFGGAIVQYGANHGQTLTAFRATFIATGAVEVLCAAATIPLLLRLIRARRTS